MIDIFNYKKNLLIKEYELLIPMLTENRRIELQVRGWCLTLLILILGSSIELEINNTVSLLLSISAFFLFFLLSLSQIYFLTTVSERIHVLQNTLNNINTLDNGQLSEIQTPLVLRKHTRREACKKTFYGLKYKNFILLSHTIFLTYNILIHYS